GLCCGRRGRRRGRDRARPRGRAVAMVLHTRLARLARCGCVGGRAHGGPPMSVFFRALERAERERAQRDGHADTEGQAAPGRVPSAAADERPGDTPDSAREGRRPGSGPGVLRPETVAVAGPAGEERTQWDGTAPIDPVLVSL